MPSYTLAEILDRAEQLAAGVGDDPQNSPIVDNGLTAETLLPHVWHIVTTRTAKDQKRQHLLRRSKTLTFTNGAAPLAADILTEALATATFDDPEIGSLMSWVTYMFDFQRPMRTMLGSYTISESGELLIRLPGTNYELQGGFNGDLDITFVCVPGLTDPVDVPDEIIDEVIAGVAGALRGEDPWKKMIMEVVS